MKTILPRFFLWPVILVCAALFSCHSALAQFPQQGTKLVGTGAVGNAYQGWSASLSADGNTAIFGGYFDNNRAGAAWVWTRSEGVWTQQGNKLVGSGTVGNAWQGTSVSLSADGNTAIVGGHEDNSAAGAAWVWTRSGGVWTQQGTKLVGSGAVGNAAQGVSVSISADGNTAIAGGVIDNNGQGAAWIWTRSGGVWTQQGTKLVGSGAVGNAWQGRSVSLSADGNTAIVGGNEDNSFTGAAWVWCRSGGVWTQQGTKLVGSGAVGKAQQGWSVSLSADGNTAIIGGPPDNSAAGAAWVWTRSGGVWTQQGNKLVGSGVVGSAEQGRSVSLSADGNTAIVGGYSDNNLAGAAWVWTRSGGVWTQQGNKLVGSGAVGVARQGQSVSVSADGKTAIVGGYGDNSLAGGAAWVFATSIPLPPQKIFLAFGQPSSFSVSYKFEWNSIFPFLNRSGSLPAASISDSYRSAVTSKLKEIFSRSGVHNIEWTASDSSDALVVYFCPTLTPDVLYGYSLPPPDRFNSDRRGKMIVFVQESFPDATEDAKTAAHEIGHLLGLRHVKPNNDEVMNSDGSAASPQFFNAVSGITDPITLFSLFSPRTHNPLYHLLRYVDGWSPAQLQSAGISPGSWDTGNTVTTQLSFENSNLRLHNITLFVSGGETETTFVLEEIHSATLAELSDRIFTVPQGQGIILLASSTTNGPLDVISSTGNPFVATNQIVSTDVATNSFVLFRQDSPTNAVALANATAQSDSQTPYCDIFLSAPTILRLEFRGTLQSSTTLTNWTDVATNVTSPHFIVVGSTNSAEFFRSRQ